MLLKSDIIDIEAALQFDIPVVESYQEFVARM